MAKKRNLQDIRILTSKICLDLYKSVPDDITDEDYNLLIWSIIQSLSVGHYNSLANEKLEKERNHE